jgi:hypothetical protein
VTQASRANAAILLARTRPVGTARTGGLSLFLVPLDDKAVRRVPMRKTVHNAIDSCELYLDDLRIPEEYLIGEEGRGFEHILSALNSERVLAAAEAVGLGRAALQRAVEYANERQSFGHPIGSYQAISHPLARASAKLSGAWLATLNGANKIDRGVDAGAAAYEALYLASDACYLAVVPARAGHPGNHAQLPGAQRAGARAVVLNGRMRRPGRSGHCAPLIGRPRRSSPGAQNRIVRPRAPGGRCRTKRNDPPIVRKCLSLDLQTRNHRVSAIR